jgi:hypothetical protein
VTQFQEALAARAIAASSKVRAASVRACICACICACVFAGQVEITQSTKWLMQIALFIRVGPIFEVVIAHAAHSATQAKTIFILQLHDGKLHCASVGLMTAKHRRCDPSWTALTKAE